ncbi:P1 family peptidase [Sediminibacterium sp. KACHI17]|uniref:P1 family peptidase n=1 Tax=Sediminibacterium sp. KACHI17 TaxID=1751071 RepID=A0AAT9GK52_9BACT
MKLPFLLLLAFGLSSAIAQQRACAIGLKIGVLEPGKFNSITDVTGVKVGHTTLIKGNDIRTGVTAILPHTGNLFQEKVPAAIYVGNGFGKLAGSTQVKELGNIETPIILTNTLSVATAMEAVIEHTLSQKGNEQVQSVNAVVGETNDGGLNDIRGRHIQKADVLHAINTASDGMVAEGSVGAGTGTICFGFKGGIGTSSRKLPESLGGYTVGVLVQTNFGGVLEINGVPVGQALGQFSFSRELSKKSDGSCMIVVATDAPLDGRNLERLAKRAFMALAKTGGVASNGSGDYVIAFSTDSSLRIPHVARTKTLSTSLLVNDAVTPLFLAAIEATEEAVLNSLFMSTTMKGKDNREIPGLPVEKVKEILRKYNKIK